MSTTALSARRLYVIFAMHALSQGGLFARIPDLQQALGLDEAQLGLALLGQPIGAIAAFLVAGRLVERLGTRIVMLPSIPLMAVFLALAAVAPNALLLMAGLAAMGAVFALANVAINVEADRVEAAIGRRIFNTCHGVWSASMLATTLIATVMRGADVPPALHFGIIIVPVVIGMALAAWPMTPAPARPHAKSGTARRFALPSTMTLLLLGYAFGSALLEGGLRNWSVIFMRDSFAAPEWVHTLTLPAFLVTQSIGRLLADRAVARFGPVRLARALGLTALAGLLLVVFSPNLYVALLGFALIGAGVCVTFPLSTSAAAHLGDRPASENVAALTMSQQILLLGTPAILGWIANAASIRLTFAVMLPTLLLAIYLARHLAPQRLELAAAAT